MSTNPSVCQFTCAHSAHTPVPCYQLTLMGLGDHSFAGRMRISTFRCSTQVPVSQMEDKPIRIEVERGRSSSLTQYAAALHPSQTEVLCCLLLFALAVVPQSCRQDFPTLRSPVCYLLAYVAGTGPGMLQFGHLLNHDAFFSKERPMSCWTFDWAG